MKHADIIQGYSIAELERTISRIRCMDDQGQSPTPAASLAEHRIYIPEPEAWAARVKVGWEKEYCYARMPGQDYLHLLLNGEIYVQNKDEKLCLTCAMRRGVVTTDRLYWQHRPRVTSIPAPGLG